MQCKKKKKNSSWHIDEKPLQLKKNILCVQHSAIKVSDGILTAGAFRCALYGVSIDGPTDVCESCTQGKDNTVQVSPWTLSCNDKISQGM